MIAVNVDDIAYTSPSVAENQNESEKVYAKAPTNPLPKIPIFWAKESSLLSFEMKIIFFAKAVIVQNKNKIVNALHKADIKFIMNATLVTSLANKLKNLPNN